MKKNILFAAISLLVVFGLLFSAVQVNAAPLATKPTPKAGQQNKPNNPQSDEKGNKGGNKDKNGNKGNNGNNGNNGNKQNGNQSDQGQGKDKDKKGKVQNFIGTISAVPSSISTDATAPSILSLIQRGGGSVDFVVNDSTEVKIPGMKNASVSDLKIGDSAVVHAILDSKGVLTARKINLVPGKPMHFHYVGTVTAYTAGATISIMTKDGKEMTFVINSSTTFFPPELVDQLAVGVTVTIVSGPAKGGGEQVAETIVIFVDQNKYEGTVTAYTAGASITIDVAGTPKKFAITPGTAITPANMVASLNVGFVVSIVASPVLGTGDPAALSIEIKTLSITGMVTAYSAGTSISVKDSSNVVTMVTVNAATTISPAADAPNLAEGALVTVLANPAVAPATNPTALSITITKIQYLGTITALTYDTVDPTKLVSVVIQFNATSPLRTFVVTPATTITLIAPATALAVGNVVLVVPVAAVVPLTAQSITVQP